MVFMVMVIVMVFMIMLMVFMMMFFLQLRLLVELPFSAINQCNSTQLSGEHVASLYPPPPPPPHHHHFEEKNVLLLLFFQRWKPSKTNDHFAKCHWLFLCSCCAGILQKYLQMWKHCENTFQISKNPKRHRLRIDEQNESLDWWTWLGLAGTILI